jgi:hypothetical protein
MAVDRRHRGIASELACAWHGRNRLRTANGRVSGLPGTHLWLNMGMIGFLKKYMKVGVTFHDVSGFGCFFRTQHMN